MPIIGRANKQQLRTALHAYIINMMMGMSDEQKHNFHIFPWLELLIKELIKEASLLNMGGQERQANIQFK